MSAPHDRSEFERSSASCQGGFDRSEFQTDREWEETEEARMDLRDFIDADEGCPDEDRERTQAEDWR
jgi:hypothetical protein